MVRVAGTRRAALRADAELVAIPVFEEDLAERVADVGVADAALGRALKVAAERERFRGRAEQLLQVSTVGRVEASRVVLVGLGPKARGAAMPGQGFEPLRMAAGGVARLAAKAGAESIAFALPAGLEPAGAARAVTEGVLLGSYRFGKYKSDRDEARPLRSLLLGTGESGDAGVAEAIELARAMAEAVAWARDLVNEAPMHCTPTRLARAAQELARASGLRCEVRGPKELAALEMGMFLGVTRGSVEEPRLIKLSWVPRGGASAKPLVLVGKGLTFDSGGLSLKPTDSMVTMNGDMAGSAAVLAAMKLVAKLAPPFPVHALVGACENMPDGHAYKPSDVLTAYNGKTVEITNTDAEGRLVLGDVLAWAVDTLEPAAIVDVATLTGACVVALGSYTVGTFGPDGPAIDGVLAAARAAGEDFWRMPLVEAVKENLKSDVADMKNSGARWGGAIAAAHFLHEFTGDVPWAHLDIAGPSHSDKERGYVAKGGTGVAVRTLVELVRSWAPAAAGGAPARGRRRKAR